MLHKLNTTGRALALAATLTAAPGYAVTFGVIPIEEEYALAMQVQTDLTIAMMNQILAPMGQTTRPATVTGSFSLDDSTVDDPYDGTAQQVLEWDTGTQVPTGLPDVNRINMRLRAYFDALEAALVVEMEGEGTWTEGLYKGTPFETFGTYKEYDDNTAIVDLELLTQGGEGDGYVFGTLKKTKANDRLVAEADWDILYMKFEFDQTDGSFTSRVYSKGSTWTQGIRNSGKLGASNLDYDITNVPVPPAGLLLGTALLIPVLRRRRSGS